MQKNRVFPAGQRSAGQRPGDPPGGDGAFPPGPSSEWELIVVAEPGYGLRSKRDGVESASGADVAPLARLLEAEQIVLEPLFGNEDRLRREKQAAPAADGAELPDLSVFYRVEAAPERMAELARQLAQQPMVSAAYVKPPAELAHAARDVEWEALNSMTPDIQDAPPVTADFTSRQGYLDAAPGGIDARYAWTQGGGGGSGVRVIDLEWGWRFSHEDLIQNQGGIVGGTGSSDTNHGTAVLGEISGDRNGIGITGIAPEAVISAVAFSMPTATAIRDAADRLRPGDIMLLEIHRPGPRYAFAGRADQLGYIAVEWWPDDFAAIRYASSKGIIVVEAAGNGAENLDDGLYNTRPAGFPATWTNPFNRANPQCGAVVVGAGAPPPGTHGNDHGPDRSRLGFSNFGACIDAQGWGREVTTTGYGDLQGGANADLWYTDRFSGTSSASPIVVGALACTQGVLRARGRIPLSPARARDVLRSTGSPQQDAPGRPASQRIGNRPNLRQILAAVTAPVAPWVGVQFRGNVPAGASRRWFTYNWPAHWHVLWTVIPTTAHPGAPQIKWQVQVERASDAYITYWITITNVSSTPCDIEARYAVLGW
ncbi:S8 family serine peptidase [Massilia sp. MB5]|uniref:S8 family peptidase n=1 Tax=unclassified Massilia TaxID=2609279 RepID=UPI0009E39C28|nr:MULTISPECIES: S8 family peptidase [unclassified Massilia]UMR31633.1 S8 family serine peptidase [Massilia sp. MB5]